MTVKPLTKEQLHKVGRVNTPFALLFLIDYLQSEATAEVLCEYLGCHRSGLSRKKKVLRESFEVELTYYYTGGRAGSGYYRILDWSFIDPDGLRSFFYRHAISTDTE